MKQKAPPLSKEKAHTVYIDNGKRMPGVTTITGQLNKPALVPWAWNLGREGIDWKSFRDKKANIGTLAHYYILCHYKNLEPVADDFSKNEIDAAENALLSFYEWEKSFPIKPIFIEEPLISRRYRFGGTPDLVGEDKDGNLCLIDFKTGKDIYREAYYQVAGGYSILLEEKIDFTQIAIRILNIGRGEDEKFKEVIIEGKEIGLYEKGFLGLLNFYYIDKEIKRLRRL